MKMESRKAFSRNLLMEAIARYGVAPCGCKDMSGFQSFVFELQIPGKPIILRMTHNSHRTQEEISGEIQILNSCRSSRLPVPTVLPSTNGRLHERVFAEDGSYFSVVAFEKLLGVQPSISVHGNVYIKRLGILMGRLHRLSFELTHAGVAFDRPTWYDEDNYNPYFLRGAEGLQGRLIQLREKLLKLPTNDLAYGLIHGDIQRQNLKIKSFDLSLFDFDGAVYGFFVHDLAITLFSLLNEVGHGESKGDIENTVARLFEGYMSEFQLLDGPLELLDVLLELEEIGEFALTARSCPGGGADPWRERFSLRNLQSGKSVVNEGLKTRHLGNMAQRVHQDIIRKGFCREYGIGSQ